MNRLLEFAGHHPYLVSAAVAMVIIVIVSEMRARIQEFAALAPGDAVRMMNHGALVVDVRDDAAFETGHIVDARHIPLKDLAASAETLKRHKEKAVITCCESGMNGGTAARELGKLGFSKVFNLRGGLAAWRQENLPLVRGGAGKSTPRN
ncbi:MAG TPA: rhodanese-like domain-containing protein [Steroidobacteraceae bacterium]|jgi:rhodanese-related sulfurtransferase|nr:rhodanese-like domain-containing protein [Steroidobacteraceae bacterium]